MGECEGSAQQDQPGAVARPPRQASAEAFQGCARRAPCGYAHKDVPAFLARLRANDSITARCLEFTVLTAVRTSEATNARFTEFDLTARVWRIPGERMKANLEHRVPLCDRVVAIVRDMAATRLGPYVFPGPKPDAPLSNMAMLMMLRDLQPGVTTHGFRSSFRDLCGEETSHPHDIAEAALAHTRKDKSHAAYQRGDLLAKRRMQMAEWRAFCEGRLRRGRASR
jgi:integrase